MAGELQGFIDCAECLAVGKKTEAPVRMNKNKKLYYMCPSDGLIYPNMKEGQDKIKTRMRPINEPEKTAPTEKPPAPPVERESAEPKKVSDESAPPPPKPKKSGIWGMMP